MSIFIYMCCISFYVIFLPLQGYLAQVLAFQYQHPVIAIDACSHHGTVTNARAERIKKHYTSQMKKFGYALQSSSYLLHCDHILESIYYLLKDVRQEFQAKVLIVTL